MTIIRPFESMKGDNFRLISVGVRGEQVNAEVIWSHDDSAQNTAKLSKCISYIKCNCFINVMHEIVHPFWALLCSL